MKQLFVIILTIFTLSSCCTFIPEPKRTTPDTTKIETTYISAHRKSVVWDRMINFLSGLYSPYTINEKDYNKGTITFSYSGDPCPNVDCGMMVAKYTMPLRNELYQKEPLCSEVLEYTTCNENDKPCESSVNRRLHLETSTTIMLTQSTNAVRIEIMTQYILTKEIHIYDGYHLFKSHQYDDITFPTNTSGQFPETPAVCRATGNIENSIMELAK